MPEFTSFTSFQLGMDGDSLPRMIPEGKYRKALNALVIEHYDEEKEAVTNIKGFQALANSILSGSDNYKAVGSVFDRKNNRVIFALWHDNTGVDNNSGFYAIDIGTYVVSSILVNNIVSAFDFGWTEFMFIQMDIIGDTLFFNDQTNQPRQLYLPSVLYATSSSFLYSYRDSVKETWDSGNSYVPGEKVLYSTGVYACIANSTNDQPDISATEWTHLGTEAEFEIMRITPTLISPEESDFASQLTPPLFAPDIAYGDSVDILVNKLRGELFQFAYRYVYTDNNKSRYSPLSEVLLPEGEENLDGTFISDIRVNSKIAVEFNLGSSSVKNIELAVKIGELGTWNKWNVYEKTTSDFTTGLANKTVDFYNNNVVVPISDVDIYTTQDYIPRTANAQESVGGNVICYGTPKEGFNVDGLEVETDITIQSEDITPSGTGGTAALLAATLVRHVNNLSPAWVSGTTYSIDDQASYGGKEYVSINDTPPNAGNQPDISPTYWLELMITPYDTNALRKLSINSLLYLPSAGGNTVDADPVIFIDTGKVIDIAVSPSYTTLATPNNTEENVYNGLATNFSAQTINPAAWVNSTGYNVGDSVTYSGRIYNALRYTSYDQPDISPSDWEDIGSTLTASDWVTVALTYNAGTAYAIDDYVVYDGKTYACIQAGTGNTPTDTDYWVSVGNDGREGVIFGWFSGTNYDTNVVRDTDAANSGDITSGSVTFTGVSIDSKAKSLKKGADHEVFINYMDDEGRKSGAVKTSTGVFHVEFNSETSGYGTYDRIYAELEISSLAPDWATHYQVLYSKNQSLDMYWHWIAETFVTASGLTTIQVETQRAAVLALYSDWKFDPYTFVEGDRIRFITKASDGSILLTYTDLEIKSVDTTTGIVITIQTPVDANIGAGSQFEIYRPKAQGGEVAYGTSDVFEINEDRFHNGNDTNQSDGVPAKLILDFGDTYVRSRLYSGTPDYFGVEDEFYSDFYKERLKDGGKLYDSETGLREQTINGRIRYGGKYFETGNVNNCRTFEFDGLKDISSIFGAISHMEEFGYTLLVFQKTKSTPVYVNRTEMTQPDGSVMLITSTKVLGTDRPPEEEYGTSHPKSVAKNDREVYFYDQTNRCVYMKTVNGTKPISDDGEQLYFDQISILLKAENAAEVCGVYDPRRDLYLLTFILPIAGISETIAYHGRAQIWTSNFDFVPDLYQADDFNLFSWKFGYSYRHEGSETRCLFPSKTLPNVLEQFGFEITGIGKGQANLNSFMAVSLDALTEPDTITLTIKPTITYPEGMESELVAGNTRDEEGLFESEILRDKKTPMSLPDGTDAPDLYKLFNGRIMTGDAIQFHMVWDSASAKALVKYVAITSIEA